MYWSSSVSSPYARASIHIERVVESCRKEMRDPMFCSVLDGVAVLWGGGLVSCCVEFCTHCANMTHKIRKSNFSTIVVQCHVVSSFAENMFF